MSNDDIDFNIKIHDDISAILGRIKKESPDELVHQDESTARELPDIKVKSTNEEMISKITPIQLPKIDSEALGQIEHHSHKQVIEEPPQKQIIEEPLQKQKIESRISEKKELRASEELGLRKGLYTVKNSKFNYYFWGGAAILFLFSLIK
jgi:hypothetical protein